MLKTLLLKETEFLIIVNVKNLKHKLINQSKFTSEEIEKIKDFYKKTKNYVISNYNEKYQPKDYI